MLETALRHQIVQEDVESIVACDLPWTNLSGKTVLVSGAAGFLPAYMIETLLSLNQHWPLPPVRIVGLVRNLPRALARFSAYSGRCDLELLEHDVTQPLPRLERPDLIIHAASQASPKYYGSDPVGTLSANVLGTHHLLDLAHRRRCEGFLFFSSSEIYGSRDDTHLPCSEDHYGKVDPLDERACYAESKRLGETMCVSWHRQFGVPAKIVRPFHTYGPGMKLDDGRVFSDFVADVVHRRPIVLRSSGEARRAFCYLADAVKGFFTVLLKGCSGEAYNIGNDQSECSIAELADLLVNLFAERALKVVHRPPSDDRDVRPSGITRHRPDIAKAQRLGWNPSVSLAEGFRRTVRSFE